MHNANQPPKMHQSLYSAMLTASRHPSATPLALSSEPTFYPTTKVLLDKFIQRNPEIWLNIISYSHIAQETKPTQRIATSARGTPIYRVGIGLAEELFLNTVSSHQPYYRTTTLSNNFKRGLAYREGNIQLPSLVQPIIMPIENYYFTLDYQGNGRLVVKNSLDTSPQQLTDHQTLLIALDMFKSLHTRPTTAE